MGVRRGVVRSAHSHRFSQRLAQPAARESKDDGNAMLARFLDYFFYLVVKAPFALCCVCVGGGACVGMCVHACACSAYRVVNFCGLCEEDFVRVNSHTGLGSMLGATNTTCASCVRTDRWTSRRPV